ncbi:MAG TPA: DUF3795 domain-containing protein [Geobacteraceae bacterium]
MKTEEKKPEVDKRLAAVCGLYCGACALFIATAEDAERLGQLAARLGLSVEEARCYGCGSDHRSAFCRSCARAACAAERGVEFCGFCTAYPCEDLRKFQAERPHRIELWDDLARIRTIGCEAWLRQIPANYTCPQCRTINSAYDLACRKCGNAPSCDYVAEHGEEVKRFLAGR